MTPSLKDMREAEETAKKKHYFCTNCGYSPTNRPDWCDMGCGSDYNKIINISIALAQCRADTIRECLERIPFDEITRIDLKTDADQRKEGWNAARAALLSASEGHNLTEK